MRWMILGAAVVAHGAAAQTAPTAALKPPIAAKKPHIVKAPFGAERQDEYYWLRDDTRKNPEMLAYLNAENAYADQQLKPVAALQKAMFDETVARIKQDDSSVPYEKNGYLYYTRFETGANYPIVARRKGNMQAPEEILFDQPKMAAGHGFFQIGDWTVSPDGTKIAWAEDLVGRRQFVLKVKDIATGQILPDSVSNIEANLVWGGDGKALLYVGKDPVSLRSDKVFLHTLGTTAADRLVYQEPDTSFYTGIGRTADDAYVCVAVGSTVMTEQRCAPQGDLATFTIVAPRERDILYDSDHVGGRWIMRTNRTAPNYKLVTRADGATAWTDLVPASATISSRSRSAAAATSGCGCSRTTARSRR